MVNLKDKMNIKIYADGADLNSFEELNKNPKIRGFTTNPSLMKKSGVTDYKKFAKEVLKIVKQKPVSFEVFTDDIDEMEAQAREISTWGENIYVKIPITNSKNVKTNQIIKKLSDDKIKCNVTAVFTIDQVKDIINVVDNKTDLIISIFAGRIADTGLDPINTMKEAIELCKSKKNIEILWASTREIFNVVQANNINCHIITVPNSILLKMSNFGKNLEKLSLETVNSFLIDAQKSGFKI